MKQENSPCYDSHSSSPLAMGHLLLLPCFIEKGILYRKVFLFFLIKKKKKLTWVVEHNITLFIVNAL